MMFSERDIDGILARGDGVTVDGVLVPALISDNYETAELGRYTVSSNAPLVTVKDARKYPGTRAIRQEQTVVIRGEPYIAKVVRPDGEGFVEVLCVETS